MSAPHPASADPVTAYAHQVVAGDVPAGRWHKAACQRHLNDLAHAEAQGLQWRPELVQKLILFARLCKHFKGEWAGQPIHLEPWEVFIIGSLFGWVRLSDGLRRYRNAFVELPRGQGKSTLAAIIALYMTFFDGEPGAEGYCFATKKDQAKIVLRTARRFVLSSKVLRKRIQALRYNLSDEDTESKLDILGSDSDNQDGLRPHVAIADEVHRHKTSDMIEVVESGMGTRREPLLLEITTAGENPESVYEHHFNTSTQVLEGADVPEWFAFIASADPEDDPCSEETWRKANPNFGISVKPDFLLKEMRKAIADPTEWPKFRRLYLGQKVAGADSYFPVEAWDACDTPMLPDEVLQRFPCTNGVDLSSRVDLTASVTVWLLKGEQVGLAAGDWLVLKPRLWVPGANVEERRRKDRVPYPTWIQQGHLESTDGNVVDQAVIKAHVVAQKDAWPLLREVAYDPWNAGELALRLQDDHGMVTIEARQGAKTLSEPTKRVKELLLNRRIIHGNHPVLRWNFSNVRVREDGNGNVVPDKKRSRGRIDGAVASVMGVWREMLATPARRSKYETQDMVRITAGR